MVSIKREVIVIGKISQGSINAVQKVWSTGCDAVVRVIFPVFACAQQCLKQAAESTLVGRVCVFACTHTPEEFTVLIRDLELVATRGIEKGKFADTDAMLGITDSNSSDKTAEEWKALASVAAKMVKTAKVVCVYCVQLRHNFLETCKDLRDGCSTAWANCFMASEKSKEVEMQELGIPAKP